MAAVSVAEATAASDARRTDLSDKAVCGPGEAPPGPGEALMALTAKAQYACLAMIQLAAERDSPDPTPLRLVADRHGIPPTFLVQILNQLKRAGLVSSVRGAAGGYRLQGDPATISLAQVVDAIEAADPPACAAEQSPLAPAIVALGRRLQAARRRCLAEVTLEELAAQAAAHAEPMWYI